MKTLTIIAAALAVGLLGVNEAKAQMVYNMNGRVYVDNRDLPDKSYTLNTLNADHTENSATNTLFLRFEVALSDEPGNLTWAIEKAACAARGVRWRLPTQRELLLIFALKELFEMAGSAPFAKAMYQSSTTSYSSDLNYLYVNFQNGVTAYWNKSATNHSARCICEVP